MVELIEYQLGEDSERVPSSGGVSGDPFVFVVKGGEFFDVCIGEFVLANFCC